MKKIIAIALAVLMLASLATVSFAATDGDSPGGDVKHKVTVYLNYGANTKLYSEEVLNDGDSTTITAPDVAGYVYKNMVITGEFRSSKTTTEKSVTITPTGDVTVNINYVKESVPGNPQPFPGSPAAPAGPVDSSTTSPDTGVNVALVALIALMGAFGVAVAAKKLFVK